MANNFNDKLSDLRAAQTETQTLVKGLAEKVEKYIDVDEFRHQELIEFRVEASKHLASAATILQDIKTEVDCVVNVNIPELQKEQAGQKATVKIHGWLIKAIVGVTLLAVLGGTVTTLATCEQSATANPSEEASLVDIDRELP